MDTQLTQFSLQIESLQRQLLSVKNELESVASVKEILMNQSKDYQNEIQRLQVNLSSSSLVILQLNSIIDYECVII